ncbi:MAG: CocE/NonD family hydrolase, partial [Desulfobacteraceae bacterium]|nr:CocE/NonD family hydrolase [Desulfobacteraceae bacterium]
AEKISEPFKYSGYSSPEYNNFTTSSLFVTMSDGVKLAAIIYLPSDGPSQGQFPVILSYSAYHREGINPETGETLERYREGTLKFFTSYGYAFVAVDKRGSGASYGSHVAFTPQFAADGKEVVDWLAQQSWCDGNVGMVGASYEGWAQFATAGRKPEALKCIIPEIYGIDLFTAAGNNPGGIYGRRGMWGPGPLYTNAYTPNHPVPIFGHPTTPVIDEDGDGELADEIPLDLDGDGSFVEDYQLPDNPPQYTDGADRQHIYYNATLEHLANGVIMPQDIYFRDVPFVDGHDCTFDELNPNDYPIRIAESGVAIYNMGGWFDAFVRGTTQWQSTLRATNPTRMILGPGIHCAPGLIVVSIGPYWEYFGEDPEAVHNGYSMERLRFLDHYLKGIENGIDKEPPVYIYVMNGEGWRSENEWPLARQTTTALYFEEGNTLSGIVKTSGSDDYTADFSHDSRQESMSANRWNLGKPEVVNIRNDKDLKCITYDSEPLDKNTEVTGHPIVRLWVSSTADYGDFFVYLEDIDENGDAYFVTDGMLRAGFAKLVPNEDMLPPNPGIDILPDLPWHGYKESDYTDGILANGNVVELVFDLMPTSWVFRKGHKFRVSIACADWPTFRLHHKLSPGNDPEDPDNIVPTITVYRDAAHQSRIELPVIPSEPVEKISEPFKYSGYTFQEYNSFARSSEYVAARDGTRLAVTTYLPSGGPSDGPYPALFLFTPYHRENIDLEAGQLRMEGDAMIPFFLSYGYAVAIADMRGTGASFGTKLMDFSHQVGRDGKDLVDWIAGQSWCNGNIGMIGGSYLGFATYATAAEKPALKCIVPEIAPFDAFSDPTYYPGGIFNKTWADFFAPVLISCDHNTRGLGPLPTAPAVDEDGDGYLADEIPMDLDGDGYFTDDYQLPGNPPQYSDGNERQHIYYLATMEHVSNIVYNESTENLFFRDAEIADGYTFQDMSPSYLPGAIAESGIPMYAVGGWFDAFARAMAHWHVTLEATNPARFLIGPTPHGGVGFRKSWNFGPYVEYFGEDSKELATSYNTERLRFFDYHLKGTENNIDKQSPVTIFVMNGQGWRSEDEWPLARQTTADLYFEEGNTLSSDRKTEGSDDYKADFTHDTRDTVANKNRYTLGVPGALWMRTELDKKCLTYTSAPVEQDTEVTGHPIVHLWVSSTADYGDFFVYLEDV